MRRSVHCATLGGARLSVTYAIGMKSEKLYKQVMDQIIWKQFEDIAQGLL